MLNGLEKERLQLIQHYINAYRGDLVEQLNQIQYQKIYSSQDLCDSRVLVTVSTSGLTNVCQNNVIKNLSNLLIPDIPTEYLQLLKKSNDHDRAILYKNFGSNRLPIKYTSVIDEEVNPDVAISAFMTDPEELKQLEQNLLIHLQSMSQNQN